MSARDDMNALYAQSKALNRMALLFYCANLLAALLSLWVQDSKGLMITLQLVSSVLFLIISVIDECLCWYDAESARRKGNLMNAFDVNLIEYTTDGYYNNNLPPSTMKYSVNCFESLFFTKAVVKRMLIPNALKAGIAIIIIICSMLLLGSNDLLLIICQTMMSSYILLGVIMLFVFYCRVCLLYDELFHSLVTTAVTTIEQQRLILSLAVEYEACKAYFKVRVDSKMFANMNNELSAKWNEICMKIHIDEKMLIR